MTTAIIPAPSTDVDLSKLTREAVLRGVDDVIVSLYQTGDIAHAVAVLNAFDKFMDVSGIARAKMLWGCKLWFTGTEQKGDFYEKFGIAEKHQRTYADRLIRLWDCIDKDMVPKSVQKRQVRDLLPITEALSQGYDLDKATWRKLEQALDTNEINEILREVKGKPPRKGSLSLTVDDKGTITAWHEGQPYFCGSLNVVDTAEPIVKAVTRIIERSGIKRK